MGESLIVRKGGSGGSVEEYFTPTGTEQKLIAIFDDSFSFSTLWKTLEKVTYFDFKTGKTKIPKRYFAFFWADSNSARFATLAELDVIHEVRSGTITFSTRLVDTGSALELQVKRSSSNSNAVYAGIILIYEE